MINNQGIRFVCLPGCSNCCSIPDGFVFLSEQEARRIAYDLEMDFTEFKNFFIREIDDQLALVDGEDEACVFLEKGRCMIYEQRPLQCRTFPFWKENMETAKRWQQTKQVCPGIDQGRLFSKEEIGEILNAKSPDSKQTVY